jgi:hypothetical protein
VERNARRPADAELDGNRASLKAAGRFAERAQIADEPEEPVDVER